MALVEVPGTHLYVEERGDGPPLLVIHGAGEDATVLGAQADHLAVAGFRAIVHDRRGTRRSGRADWPGVGADQHADDAAALLTALDATPAVVLGVSSGAIVALALAARHPGLVAHVVAWEPPAVGLLPGGAEATDGLLAPARALLAADPDDIAGAGLLFLDAINGGPVDRDDPLLPTILANAEAMVRDDPTITLRAFTADELSGVDLTLAIGTAANGFIRGGVERLAELTGREPLVVEAEHEVYRRDPEVLGDVVASRCLPLSG